MEVANIVLSLAGDAGNTVPKFNVTAAEIAVLREIHGEEAVHDIEPIGTIERTSRAERQRLTEIYGRMHEGQRRAPAVERLFPGAAARVFETIEELELPEDFFKAESRVGAGISTRKILEREAAEAAPVEQPVVTPFKKGAKKTKAASKKKKADEPKPDETPAPEEAGEPDDGIGDMDDAADSADDNLFE